MIEMNAFYSQLNQPEDSLDESFRRLRKIKTSQLEEILIVRSQLQWEAWPAA